MIKMNNIDTLIEQLCPEGVEYKELGKLATIETGTQLNKTAMAEIGDFPVLNGGINPSGYYNLYNTEAKTIAISQGGASAGYVNFMKTKFWAGAHCFVVKPTNSAIDNKFVFYLLKNDQEKLMNAKLGAGIPGLNKKELTTYQIPLPPLPIQQEIVNILDKFTQLQAELQAELEVRQKQYEHYRNELLEFEDDEVELKTLGEVCIVSSGGTPLKAEKSYWTNGTIPWLKSEACKEKSVFSANDYITELGLKKSGAKLLCQSTTLMALVGATKCKTAFLEFEATTNQNIAGIRSKNETFLLDKFIFYYLMNLYKELVKNLGQYEMLNLGQIREFKIPIPPLTEQNRIVSILDQFNKLVNDITVGLPAEILARHKQYEFYRGKLLDFKSISNG